MIKTFADKRTADLFVKGAAKGVPPDVLRRAVRRLEYVDWPPASTIFDRRRGTDFMPSRETGSANRRLQ